MKKYLLLFFLVGLLASCDKDDDLSDDCGNDLIFHYDSLSGNCINCKGKIGLNPFDLNQINTTKSAECMKFPAMHLVFVLDTTEIDNFIELGHNEISDYNFKGADLDSTTLHFNELINSYFEGTKMSQLEFGYAKISGKIDEFTEIPEGCPIENDSISCIR